MSNFYMNNNIENLLNYNNAIKSNNINHILFGIIVISIILYLVYDLFSWKNKKKNITFENNNLQKNRKGCTTCQSNKVKEEQNNLILKYETENFKEIFNKSEN